MKELWELHQIQLSFNGWSILLVGLVVAAVSAFFAIWGLMHVLERFSAWPFVVYLQQPNSRYWRAPIISNLAT